MPRFDCWEPAQGMTAKDATPATNYRSAKLAAAAYAEHRDFMELHYPDERVVHVRDSRGRETVWTCTAKAVRSYTAEARS